MANATSYKNITPTEVSGFLKAIIGIIREWKRCDFVSIVARNRQQYRQNQDGYNLPFQGLTPLAVVLRPLRASGNLRTWRIILVRNGRREIDFHLGVICNFTFISIVMNFRKVILKSHLQWPIQII